jgi:hypothetical protein
MTGRGTWRFCDYLPEPVPGLVRIPAMTGETVWADLPEFRALSAYRTEVMALRFCAQASGVLAGSTGRDLP